MSAWPVVANVLSYEVPAANDVGIVLVLVLVFLVLTSAASQQRMLSSPTSTPTLEGPGVGVDTAGAH